MKHFTFILIFAISISSCSNSDKKTTPENKHLKYAELAKANWFVGKWINTSDKIISTENWKQESDSSLIGESFVVIGKDTVSSESIRLVQMNKNLFYIPTVKEQNGGEPVEFKMTSSKEDQLVFENLEHDFPQKIIYTKITEDSTLAEISGLVKGKLHSQQFPLTRIK